MWWFDFCLVSKVHIIYVSGFSVGPKNDEQIGMKANELDMTHFLNPLTSLF